MIKQLLTAVQNNLSTLKTIRYVDEDWGQLHYDNPPVQFPCALIDAGGFEFEDVASFAQRARGEIYITIADQRLGKTSANAPTGQKETMFAFFDTLLQVQKKLHRLDLPGCEPLIRKAIHRIRRGDTIREYKITFSTEFRDETE